MSKIEFNKFIVKTLYFKKVKSVNSLKNLDIYKLTVVIEIKLFVKIKINKKFSRCYDKQSWEFSGYDLPPTFGILYIKLIKENKIYL